MSRSNCKLRLSRGRRKPHINTIFKCHWLHLKRSEFFYFVKNRDSSWFINLKVIAVMTFRLEEKRYYVKKFTGADQTLASVGLCYPPQLTWASAESSWDNMLLSKWCFRSVSSFKLYLKPRKENISDKHQQFSPKLLNILCVKGKDDSTKGSAAQLLNVWQAAHLEWTSILS